MNFKKVVEKYTSVQLELYESLQNDTKAFIGKKLTEEILENIKQTIGLFEKREWIDVWFNILNRSYRHETHITEKTSAKSVIDEYENDLKIIDFAIDEGESRFSMISVLYLVQKKYVLWA